MAFDSSDIYELARKYNSHVVGYYDSVISRLSSKLYRVDGFSFVGSNQSQPLRFFIIPLDDNQQGRQITVDPEDILTYDELAHIWLSTHELFDKSSQVFKGCFTKSLAPLKADRDALRNLLDQYSKRGLIIEEDSTCAITAE